MNNNFKFVSYDAMFSKNYLHIEFLILQITEGQSLVPHQQQTPELLTPHRALPTPPGVPPPQGVYTPTLARSHPRHSNPHMKLKMTLMKYAGEGWRDCKTDESHRHHYFIYLFLYVKLLILVS